MGLPRISMENINAYAEQIATETKKGNPLTCFKRMADKPEYIMLIIMLAPVINNPITGAISIANILSIIDRQIEGDQLDKQIED